MIDVHAAASWMLAQINKDGCVYQDAVVDYLVRAKAEKLLKENVYGDWVIGTQLLAVFRKLTETNVVWVKSEKYWRTRVSEDEPGREQRG